MLCIIVFNNAVFSTEQKEKRGLLPAVFRLPLVEAVLADENDLILTAHLRHVLCLVLLPTVCTDCMSGVRRGKSDCNNCEDCECDDCEVLLHGCFLCFRAFRWCYYITFSCTATAELVFFLFFQPSFYPLANACF